MDERSPARRTGGAFIAWGSPTAAPVQQMSVVSVSACRADINVAPTSYSYASGGGRVQQATLVSSGKSKFRDV